LRLGDLLHLCRTLLPRNTSIRPDQRCRSLSVLLFPASRFASPAVPPSRSEPVAPDLPVDALDYALPDGLIATAPANPRDSARMMVVRLVATDDDAIEHRHIRDLPDYLHAGDALVFNTSAVLPARFFGRRVDPGSGGGRVEGLFLGTTTADAKSDARSWRVMLRSNGRLRAGMQIELATRDGKAGGVVLTLRDKHEDAWQVDVDGAGDVHPAAVLDRLGVTPLPPYILRARQSQASAAAPADREAAADDADDLDRAWYQTVYADPNQRGSVAAPTAGLHFTDNLLGRLADQGVERVDVVLHVGHGTFKPVTATTLAEHDMHTESFVVPARSRARLADRLAHREAGDTTGRIIAVGTTSVRVLESLDRQDLRSGASADLYGETDLLIAPPYVFRHIDGLLTNFHLPRSTLLALVGAMVGLDRLHAIYREAIARSYRFYSYGDAMLILP
jgi:S-adenosylmethionine:tRNA ribosyltransferase-isomerase